MILASLKKLPKAVEDLGKLIVAIGFKKLPKVQKIANSGHTDYLPSSNPIAALYLHNCVQLTLSYNV